MRKFQVCTLDVWGNKEDGFYVNAGFEAGIITAAGAITNAEIWDALVDMGLAWGELSQAIFIWADDGFCSIDGAKTGIPMFQLSVMEED